MNKRIGIGALLLLAAALSLFVYLGERATDRVANMAAASSGVVSVNKAGGFLWMNDRVYHARAKLLFERGLSRLGNPSLRDADFNLALRNFLRSLTLNPFSPTAHFDFGQALQYLNALDFNSGVRYFDEYRKAADLSGVDTSIYFEVGKVLLSRWSGLSPDERLFTERIIRSVLSFRRAERETRCAEVLNLWELNVGDVAVLKKALPEDVDVLRQAAGFLGEKGLFLETRQKFLADAETLDFRKAREEARTGQSALQSTRMAEAAEHYRTAGRLLDGIRFYQNLSPQAGEITSSEFQELQKSVRLGILKCALDNSPEPAKFIEDFRAYLNVEDSAGAIGDLESLLKTRGLIDEQLKNGFLDFSRLNLKLELSFKQNRFRDVYQTGLALTQNLLVVPVDQRKSYGRIFELVGDACQKLDDLYESNSYYEKAITQGIDDAVIRIKMRRNYERLNDDAAVKAAQLLIDERLNPRETPFIDAVWKPGEAYVSTPMLDEKIYLMSINFSDYSTASPLLVSVVFNGRVIGEEFLKSDVFEIKLPAVLGSNRLEITAINRICRPIRITLVREDVLSQEGEGNVLKKAGPVSVKKQSQVITNKKNTLDN